MTNTLNLSLLNSILDALADPIFIFDEKGNYLAQFGGRDRSLYFIYPDLRGKNIRSFFPEDIAEHFLSTISKAITSQTLQVIEYFLKPEYFKLAEENSPHGGQWYEGRLSPIRTDEGRDIVVWLVRNITLRKRAEEDLRECAQKDHLTGIANRRHFMTTANHAASVARRYGYPMSLVILDIDMFKVVNDTYGHAFGDRSLQHITEVCQRSLREADTFGRIGGEEFAILLQNTTEKEALVLAERIRKAVADEPVPRLNGPVPVTVSLGVSGYDHTEKTVDAALSRADKALYVAKDSGRNKAVRWKKVKAFCKFG